MTVIDTAKIRIPSVDEINLALKCSKLTCNPKDPVAWTGQHLIVVRADREDRVSSFARRSRRHRPQRLNHYILLLSLEAIEYTNLSNLKSGLARLATATTDEFRGRRVVVEYLHASISNDQLEKPVTRKFTAHLLAPLKRQIIDYARQRDADYDREADIYAADEALRTEARAARAKRDNEKYVRQEAENEARHQANCAVLEATVAVLNAKHSCTMSLDKQPGCIRLISGQLTVQPNSCKNSDTYHIALGNCTIDQVREILESLPACCFQT